VLSVQAAKPADAATNATLTWIQDDIPTANQQAVRQGKLLLVDAWAPWCHTCLSMKHHVLDDPALHAYADRVVFAAVDTDRERNAPFLQNHEVRVWPSLFVLDPKTDRVLAFWPGAASLPEVRSLLEDALALQDAARDPNDPRYVLADARQSLARGDHQRAFERFTTALSNTPADWPRRSEALTGAMWSLYRKQDWKTCASFGAKNVDEVRGSAAPADFCYVLMACGKKLEDKNALAKATRRLEKLVASPPAEASIDDRADAMAMLADARKQAGDESGFRALHEARLKLMEAEAARADTPMAASTHDYARATSYVALGRGDEAVKMLEQREQQLPDSYEPPARLADVLLSIGRHEQALAAIDRALKHAYGPRKLRYLDTRATILEKLGRKEEMVATLREAVKGHEALARGQADQTRLEAARKRYEASLR